MNCILGVSSNIHQILLDFIEGGYYMRKIKLLMAFLLLAVINFFTLSIPTNAESSPVVQFTTSDTELFDESLQQKILLLSKNSFVTSLPHSDGWTKVQYHNHIGYIQSAHLKNATPKYMLAKYKTDPAVRISNIQQSEIIGSLPNNSIVEVYIRDSSGYAFVQYGSITGFVQKQLLVKPTAQARAVKEQKGLIVRKSASTSSEQVGHLAKETKVTMLTKIKDWAFVTSKEVSGYVQADGLKYAPTNVAKPKPVTPKPTSLSSTKMVALTFDDGPHPKVTQQILKTLEKYDAKATFFVLGESVNKYPKVLKQVFDEGHEIGNHSYSHAKLTLLPLDQIRFQIQSTDAAVKALTGENTTVFRPPYGAYDNIVTSQLKVPKVLWTVDTLDWKHHDSKKTLQVVQENVKNGSIILMHDIHQTTADSLDAILATLEKQGYEFVTVSELLKSTTSK